MKKSICICLFLMTIHLFTDAEEKFVDKQVFLFQTMGDFSAVVYITHNIDNYYEKKYQFEVINLKTNKKYSTPWHTSLPPPSFEWISDKWCQYDFGSSMGPDRRTYCFSVDKEKLSQEFFLVAFADVENELVLTADTLIELYSIFGNKKIRIPEPEDMYKTICKYFVIGNNSFIKGDFLYLEYYTEEGKLKATTIKKISIEKLLQ
ncbi:hypothetical protein [Treponema putidum]|uniref:Uncharacterized protein n=1 Tax=Treponema putidum TaxID=221027 RepID=A0ABY5HU27_9SPIR|nr:hypothetical protein [Treponema putidum]UTY28555.1 hypothetical protein E4N76_05800 [Treponema putidum]